MCEACKTDPISEITTAEEAAKILGLGYHGVMRLVAKGTLPSTLMGKSYIIRRSDIEQVRRAREILKRRRSD